MARNLAIILVVAQHILFLGGLSNDGMSGAHRFQARVLEALSQSCVDLFGLLSGYLGLTVRGWKWPKLVRLWFQVWSTGLLVLGGCAAAIWLVPSAFGGIAPTGSDWLTAVCPLARNEYWYFTAYCFVFLFAPVINRWLFADGRERIGLAFAAGVFVLVCGTTVFPGGVTWLPLAKGYSARWLLCLYVFGAALRRLSERSLASVPTFCFWGTAIIGVALTTLQRLAMASSPALKALFADEWTLHHYTSPTVTLVAAAVLLGCARLGTADGRAAGASVVRETNAALARCAFGVYLLHVQPFFFASAFKYRFAFLDRVPDGLFAVAVIGVAGTVYLVLAVVETFRRELMAKAGAAITRRWGKHA